MDPQLTIAVIGAGGAVVAAVVGGVFGLVKARQAKRLTEERNATDAALAQMGRGAIKGATYSIEEHVTSLEFDENGDGKLSREFIGIRAHQNIENLKLEFAFAFSGPNAKLKTPTIKTLPGSKLPATFVNPQFGETVVRGSVEVIGLLSPGMTAGFTLVQPFEHGLCTKRAEAMSAYQNDKFKMEYVGMLVSADIRVLRLTVKFPASHHGLSPAPSAAVFMGETESMARKETRDLENQVSFVDGVATLTVPSPTPGLQYAVAWMPPD